MAKIRTHYDNLQISRSASDAVVRAAYRGLSQKYHPDKNNDDREKTERIMKVINEAYSVLSDPQKRREHDEWIRQKEFDFNSKNPDIDPSTPSSEARSASASTEPTVDHATDGLVGQNNINWLSAIRDCLIIFVLTYIGGFVIGLAVSGSHAEPDNLLIALGVSNISFMTAGFTISGMLVKTKIFNHLIVVAALTWATGFLNVINHGVAVSEWMIGAFFIVLSMLIGGLLLSVIKKNIN